MGGPNLSPPFFFISDYIFNEKNDMLISMHITINSEIITNWRIVQTSEEKHWRVFPAYLQLQIIPTNEVVIILCFFILLVQKHAIRSHLYNYLSFNLCLILNNNCKFLVSSCNKRLLKRIPL